MNVIYKVIECFKKEKKILAGWGFEPGSSRLRSVIDLG